MVEITGRGSSEIPASNVVVAVLTRPGDDLIAALDAIERQAYGSLTTVLVGSVGGEHPGNGELETAATVGDVVDGLSPEVELVWFLHGDAQPRPDALGALVADLERTDASVAGSKILEASHPEMLESVGSATDVFGEPHSGLDEGEVDLEQYDVVRDVGFISNVSFLVRRDLLRGLAGPDRELGPQAAGLDFSQRARLAGGRVVIAPSSEVLHRGTCAEDIWAWHERAGRIRSMLKAYRPVTLLWVLPVHFLIGLVVALTRTLMGQWRSIPAFLSSWAWNIGRLGSSLTARRAFRQARAVGDEELFRYQVSGSVQLRLLGEDVSTKLGEASSEEGRLAGIVGRSKSAWRRPAVVSGLIAIVYVLLAGRSIVLDGVPIVGYALPLSGARDVFVSWLGGWNFAGLGTPDPLHPAVASSALVQTLAFGQAGFAQFLLTVVGLVAGVLGVSRLLLHAGVRGPAGFAGGVVAMIGPAIAAGTSDGHWPVIPATAAAAWAIELAVRPWPQGWRKSLGRFASLSLAAGAAALFVPFSILAVPVVVIIWWLVGGESSWKGAGLSIAAAATGAVFTFPWAIVAAATYGYSGGTPIQWSPALWVSIPAVIAAIGGLSLGSGRTAATALGALLAFGGFAASLLGLFGAGRDPTAAAIVVSTIGLGVLAGCALSYFDDARSARWLRWPTATAGVLLLATTLLVIPGGQAGLPTGHLEERLAFIPALSPETGSDRVLMVAYPPELPGEPRTLDGFSYRVFDGPMAELEEAWLASERLGDDQLVSALRQFRDGTTLRPGELLAPFGIRWIVVVGPSVFDNALALQVDLSPLPISPDFRAFENTAAVPIAVSTSSLVWQRELGSFIGEPEPDGIVRLAYNADSSWGPGWQQSDWASSLSAADGVASYQPISIYRALSVSVIALIIVLIGLAIWGREGRR